MKCRRRRYFAINPACVVVVSTRPFARGIFGVSAHSAAVMHPASAASTQHDPRTTHPTLEYLIDATSRSADRP